MVFPFILLPIAKFFAALIEVGHQIANVQIYLEYLQMVSYRVENCFLLHEKYFFFQKTF